MALTFDKLLALAIALGYTVTAAVLAPDLGGVVMIGLLTLWPLALIWFPEYLGGSWTQRKKTVLYTYDERTFRGRPLRDSHPAMVSFMGWFFLVGLPPLVYWLTTQ
jgi:hypothetical protein